MKLFASLSIFILSVSSCLAKDTTHRPPCVTSEDCESDKICLRNKCLDPCGHACGANTVCQVINPHIKCFCRPGYAGVPLLGCLKSLSDLPRCAANDDCKADRACISHYCVNPCDYELCGINTVCNVTNHIASCSCRPEHLGIPAVGCFRYRPHSKKRFHIVTSMKEDWDGSVRGCRYYNTTLKKLFYNFPRPQLVAIENLEELEEVMKLIEQRGVHRNDGFWVWSVSAHDEVEHSRKVVGRSVSKPTSFWLPENSDINGREEVCVKMRIRNRFSYDLIEEDCKERNYFICQYYE